MTEPAASAPDAPLLHTARDARGVFTLTLADPGRLNALGDGMLSAYIRQLRPARSSACARFGPVSRHDPPGGLQSLVMPAVVPLVRAR